jgi:hypothetical protein
MKYLMGMIALLTSGGCLLAQEFNTTIPKQRVAEMLCLKTGEKTSGLNKICFYNCAGSEAAITVSLAELCPLSIKH